MVQVYHPHRVIYVKASSPHPPNTEYRVSWGYENWSNTKVPVTKIQMVYNGRVNGRISPSYPDGTIDQENINHALKLLNAGEGTNGKNSRIFMCTVKLENEQSLDDVIEKSEDVILENLLKYTIPLDAGSVTCIGEDKVEENVYRLKFEIEASKSDIHPKGESNMKLIGSAGDGQTILSNLNNFNHILSKSEGNTDYTFNVGYINPSTKSSQNGTMSVRLDSTKSDLDRIISVTLNLEGFGRPLGCYNDSSLKNLADDVLKKYNL